MHHFLGEHSLGSNYHRFYLVFPVGVGRLEHFAHLNESQHIVDVVVVDNQLRQSRACENLAQLFAASLGNIHSHNLVAGNHAVAQAGVAEVESVLKQFHLTLHFSVFILALVNILL